ncbi:hypothetical protein HNQ60_004519 [Povalibacter uvarum]|uniref:MobA/VirD2-like nuclease domain-containing protein n=1 Tax=Povalibacter uvarum TaxID=732238 RepID=A0A841HUI3_9GAMM|nr:relaxase/mobilization nuclease domain-containing protein [Povalibacter uvarum]MBB6095628.1 hypothetical protein [Povalibacter uvarum]
MPAFRIEPFAGRALLDIGSFGRAGSGRRDRLSPEQIAQIARTVNRTPEVMVKVLTRNSSGLSSVAQHFDYIGRDGELEIETDDGEQVSGKRIGRALINDWNLELEQHRRTNELTAGKGRKPAKLVHKLMFSMPAGTPPSAVLKATRTLLREEFGLKHRYAFVLHTDEPHPHVHAVVKAVSEQGERLHIRKATLRRWRAEFARHLREHGVAANATERAVRGQVVEAKVDPIYRTTKDPERESTHVRAMVQDVAAAMVNRSTGHSGSTGTLRSTRRAVRDGWHAIARLLDQQGQLPLASAVRQFVQSMPPPLTERERIEAQLRAHLRERVRDRERTR